MAEANRTQTLRVDWSISTPVIPPGSGLLHSDALLAWAVTQRELAAGASTGSIRDLAEDLPLAKHFAANGSWCWCASALRWDNQTSGGRTIAAMVRRTEVTDIVQMVCDKTLRSRATKLDLASGPQRNYLLRYDVIHATSATAYMVGDADKIEALLRDVKHLGKKGNSGYGCVANTSVSVVSPEECDWRWRALPEQCGNHVPALAAIRPPYWDPTSFTSAWIPVDS